MSDRDDQQNPSTPPPTPPSASHDSASSGHNPPGYAPADAPQPGYGEQPYSEQPYGQQSYSQPGSYGQDGGYAQPNAYAQPGYGAPGPKKTLSLIGMILGIVGLVGSVVVFIPIFGSIFGLFIPAGAVVLGFLGRSREGAPARGFWLTALITGFVGIGIAIVALIGWIAFFASLDGGSFGTNY